MDLSGNTTSLSARSPHSLPPRLALSEFMAQTAPCSDSSPFSDGPSLSPGVLAGGEVVQKSIPAPAPEKLRAQAPHTQQPEEQNAPSSSPQHSPHTDWLATRQQLLPRRNQGGRAEWIRGWSEAVGIHGDGTYCACSETLQSNRHRKGKKSELGGNVRAILQGTGGATANKPAATTAEPELCRNCSRPPSPPASTASTSLTSERLGPHQSWGFRKRITELLLRVRRRPSSSSRSAHKRDPEIRHAAWPEECQPKWASGSQERGLVRPPPPSQPVQTSHSMGVFPGHSRAKTAAPSSSSSSSSSGLGGLGDSGAPRGGAARSRSMSRLQRAAALLHRVTNPPGE